MTDEEKTALNEVLKYLWADEYKSWEEAGSPKSGHIFNSMVILNNITR